MMISPKKFDKYRLPSPKDVSIYTRPENYDEIFSKTKTLKSKSDSFLLPTLDRFCSAPLWKVPELEFLKSELIRVKSLLNEMKINEWHNHTRISNPLSSVIKRIRSSITHDKFCSVAWCKLFEILSCHNAIPDNVQEAAYQLGEINLDSVYLCEAPGAFISATNHFLQTNYQSVNWNWVATTLNPYYEGNDRSETLIQDQIILSTMDHWTFFDDGTGNIMKVKNIKSLKEDVERKGLKSVQLITADGSVDCADAPDEQENITSGLHYCEMMAALEILDRGGTFVLKLFTFFECNTICKLYILSCFFDEVHVVKPAMSKEGNSEVYLICRGFLGPEYLTSERRYLLDLCDRLPTDKAIFPFESVPPEFIRRVINISHFYATLQAEVILRNVKTYGMGKQFYERMRYTKEALADHWFQSTGLRSLHTSKFLLHLDKMKQRIYFTYTTAWDQFPGSYNERISRVQSRNPATWFENIKSDFDATLEEFQGSLSVHVPLRLQVQIKIKFGKPMENIKCSRFCSDRILQLLRSYVDYARAQVPVPTVISCPCHSCANFPVNEPPTRIICFSSTSGAKFGKCDSLVNFQSQSQFWAHLWTSMKELLPSQSLFLCSVPLLTRFSLGFVTHLRQFFEFGDVFVDAGEELNGRHGIFLRNYLGESSNRQLWSQLEEICSPLALTSQPLSDSCVLEVVPIAILCSRRLCRDVTQYNNHLMMSHLHHAIHPNQSNCPRGSAAES